MTNSGEVAGLVIEGFAKAIAAKTEMLDSPDSLLSARQLSAVRASIIVDLRKCSDALTPQPRPPYVSVAAQEATELLPVQVDLREQNWQSQIRFDPGRQILHFEHVHPVGEIATSLRGAAGWRGIADVIDKRLYVAWITKAEDARLTAAGFKSRRSDPVAAYQEAGIALLDL